ncbi:MAG TPA: hypothetical protein VGS21_06410, partial [Acidimicrobiales bacterium]|nr:hypothetical protein [Acidimicrobiales bacterium]
AFVHAPGNRAVWVLVVIAAPQALIGVLAALALPVAIGTGAGLRVPREWRPGVRFSFVNWIAVLATQAPLFVLPLIVALRVPAAQNAQFYLAWSLTAAVSLVPGAIAQVVLVEGSRNDHRFRQQAAKATSVAVRLSGLALAGSFVLALLITTLYGPGYRLTAEILPPLVAASVPWSIAAIRLSEARLRFDHVTTVAVTVCLGGGIIALGFALVVALGAKGAVIAWDAGNVLAAALAIALGRSRWSPGRHAARGRRRGGLAQPPAG